MLLTIDQYLCTSQKSVLYMYLVVCHSVTQLCTQAPNHRLVIDSGSLWGAGVHVFTGLARCAMRNYRSRSPEIKDTSRMRRNHRNGTWKCPSADEGTGLHRFELRSCSINYVDCDVITRCRAADKFCLLLSSSDPSGCIIHHDPVCRHRP